jgi:hypothetical protein
MISYTAYQRGDGTVDWESYRAAQVEAGEICKTCGKILLGFSIFGNKPISGKRDCYDCHTIANDKDEVTHEVFIRCPHCKLTMDVMKDELYELTKEEGENETTCHHCNEDFSVETFITFSFKSPPLKETSE